MLRYRDSRIQRFRIAMCTLMFGALAGTPLVLGLTRPPSEGGPAALPDIPGVVGAYAHGLTSLGVAGLVAGILGLIFGFCLIAGQQREVNRRWLQQGARNRHNLLEGSRTLATIFGAAGMIVGSLAGLYAAMMAARPDLRDELLIPGFTFDLAVPCLLVGGVLYAAGRLGR
jgi:hypothetical protein